MSTPDPDRQKPSEPRTVRIRRLSRRPGITKSVISLGLVILVIIIFIMLYLARSLG